MTPPSKLARLSPPEKLARQKPAEQIAGWLPPGLWWGCDLTPSSLFPKKKNVSEDFLFFGRRHEMKKVCESDACTQTLLLPTIWVSSGLSAEHRRRDVQQKGRLKVQKWGRGRGGRVQGLGSRRRSARTLRGEWTNDSLIYFPFRLFSCSATI